MTGHGGATGLPWFVLLLHLAAGRDIKPNTTDYVIRHTDSCPDVGYFFKRDPAPNAVTPGPCYLCFCQSNGTAICGLRESHRCDVEPYYRRRHSRVRRSPVGLSDIFFRDAARDFFDRQIPGECKPFESSYSDGCPPVDWCTGCTICDCDANGHWDCHILSFCNGKERKEKVTYPGMKGSDGRRSIKNNDTKANDKKNKNTKPNNPKPNNPKPNNSKSNNSKPNKPIANNPKPNNPKLNQASKPTKRGFIKKNDQSYVPGKPKNISKNQIKNKPQNKPVNIKPVKVNQNKNNNQPKPKNNAYQKPKVSQNEEKPKDKRLKKRVKKIIIKKQIVKNNQNNRKIKKQQSPNVSNVKVTRRDISTPKPQPVLKGLQGLQALKGMNMQKLLKNDNASVKLGQQIVKQVMSSVQKILMREMQKIDETRKQRSVNCDEWKKFNNQAVNVKSNADINKNMYKMLTSKLKSLEHSRKKREILNETQAVLANLSIISLQQTGNTAVIPLPSKTQIKLLNTTTTQGVASSPTRHKQYYKYSIKDNIIDTDLKTTMLTELNAISNSDTTNTPLSTIHVLPSFENTSKTPIAENEKTFKNKTNQINNNYSSKPEFDDVKFTKWYLIKIMQNNTQQTLNKLHLLKTQPKDEDKIVPNEMQITVQVPALEMPILKNLKTNEITPQNNRYTDKATSAEVTETVDLFKKLVTEYTPPEKTTKKPIFKGLPTLLQNFLAYVKKNKTNTQTIPSNTTNIIKNLRTFFNKLFNKKENLARKSKYGLGSKEERTLQILCEHFVTCKVNKRNKFVYNRFLKYKLKRLNEESESILKSINIIKGLLHLLDAPKRDISNETMNANPLYRFHSDLQKFSAVLKGTYNTENLTETQRFQISYIKKNTQVFKKSVQRFANILKEILVTLKQDVTNVKRKGKGNAAVPIVKIKALLSKYNLVQNSFISRMFQLLKRFENTNVAPKPQKKVSEDNVRTINDKLLILNSKNIIENLRKLKNLAQELNSKRRKRHTIVKRDDALEYLLTLLEYLLKKQSRPLDHSPENDGIDFLIEAIKNAPDIKTVKKKVLTYNPVAMSSVTIGPSYVNANAISGNDADDNQVTREDDRENGDVASRDDINFTAELNEPTSRVYYLKPEVTEAYNDISSNDSKDSGANKIRRYENIDKIGFEKFESSIDDKGYDVPEILEETTVYPPTKNIESVNKVIDDTTPVSVTTYLEVSKDNKYLSKETDESADAVEKKRKLEWIEATFDRDDFDDVSYSNVTERLNKTNMTEKEARSSSKETEKESKEVVDMENMKAYIARPGESLEKLEPEEVIQRKQMEFLRSLDYGKPELDETESKDDPRSDDVFPSYF